MHVLQPSRLVRTRDKVRQAAHYEEIDCDAGEFDIHLCFHNCEINLCTSRTTTTTTKKSLEKNTKKKKRQITRVELFRREIRWSVMAGDGEDQAGGGTMQIPGHLVQHGLPLCLANFQWSGLSSLSEHSPDLSAALLISPRFSFTPVASGLNRHYRQQGWSLGLDFTPFCHTCSDSTPCKTCSGISAVAPLCAQMKRERWNVGKKTDALEFDDRAKKEDLNENGNLVEELRTNRRVFARVCRPTEAHSSSSCSSDANFGIHYTPQRKHWRSGHIFRRWTSSKVTSWSSVRGHSPPSRAPVRCTSGWSFCGSWLLSHSSSTSPAPEDFSAWIIQPTGIVNERFCDQEPSAWCTELNAVSVCNARARVNRVIIASLIYSNEYLNVSGKFQGPPLEVTQLQTLNDAKGKVRASGIG